MTWFVSSTLVPHGLRAAEGVCGSPLAPKHPRKRTDVHGREG
jgi:hypothetical protein